MTGLDIAIIIVMLLVGVWLLARWRGQRDHDCACGPACSCGAFSEDGQCHCPPAGSGVSCGCTRKVSGCVSIPPEGFTGIICPCSQYEPAEELPIAGTISTNMMLPGARDAPRNYAPVESGPFNPADYFVYPHEGESFQASYPDTEWNGFRTELRFEPDHVPLTG